MKKLFYINRDNYNISKLSRFYSEQDDVVIFTLSYSDKLKWGDKYPVYYYTDIGINAQNGIFNGLLEESYKLTYRIIDIGINKFELTAERRNLLKALPSKIHRVVSEALRAEKVIDEIIKYFKPDKIYFLKPQRNIHKKNKYQITAKINFENEVLLSRCSKENIVHQFLPIFQINRLGYLKNTFKELLNIFSTFFFDTIKSFNKKSLIIRTKINPDIKNKPIVVIYLFGYYYQRNQQIWKYFNRDQNFSFLFITDWLSDDHQKMIEKNENLNFIHMKGSLPILKRISISKKNNTSSILYNSLDNREVSYSKTLLIDYIMHYIFGLYNNYLNNDLKIQEVLGHYKPVSVLFPSYWEIQPSLLILFCKKHRIPTTAIQAGISQKNGIEIPLSDRFGIFGEWDYNNYKKTVSTKNTIFKLGWPMGDYYKKIPIQYKLNEKGNKIEILILISMGTGWIRLINFPEEIVMHEIIEAVSSYQKIQFTFRTHQGYPNEEFIKLIKFKGYSNINLNNNDSLETCILKSDYVFTQTTTAGFESLVLKRPIFFLNLYGFSDESPFQLLPSKYRINNNVEFHKILFKISMNEYSFMSHFEESRNQILSKMFYPNFHYEKLIERV